MEKPILYSDFDGVLYNTIDVSFSIMRENGCNMSDGKEIDNYFKKKLDWNRVFNEASMINNSIDKIKLLQESNLFKKIIILTKLSGNYHEERLKRDLIQMLLNDIPVITLQHELKKNMVVNAYGNILVDDEIKNCHFWNEDNGCAINFQKDNVDLEHNIINDLLDIPNTDGVKKLLKK